MTTDAASLTAEQTAALDALVRDLSVLRPATLQASDDLVADLAYDSLGRLELIVAMEHEFELDGVDDDAAVAVRTVGDLRQLLAEQLA